jgi:hypothetical protein
MLFAMTKARVASRLATLVVMLAGQPVLAQDSLAAPLIKPGDETLLIDLGGIVNQFGSTLKLNGQSHNGTDIDLERNGLKKTQSSFRGAASLRFLSRNRVDVEHFSASRTGSKTYQTEISIGDNVYPLGATVSAKAKNDFLIADYRYSFVKSDSVELAGLIGIYGGQFKFDVSATGNAGNAAAAASTSASTYVPVPLIGGSVDWYVDPRWRIGGVISGLKAHIGGVDGKAIVATAATDYTLFRNFAVGLRYMYSDLSADATKNRFDGTVKWRMDSVSLYGRLLF